MISVAILERETERREKKKPNRVLVLGIQLPFGEILVANLPKNFNFLQSISGD